MIVLELHKKDNKEKVLNQHPIKEDYENYLSNYQMIPLLIYTSNILINSVI